ncbi:group II intron reverse transcriptase domain-containing protein [Candidatus Woesearchaeota archaeon]|nr:group II intron reverse transcriptase domain-containing protein [Candidatus Woesearchaeota archaeon]
MKTFKKLYGKLTSLENLEDSFWKARKKKVNTPEVQEYEKHWRLNNIILRQELLNKTYKPNPLKTFILRDPKTRKICKSDFRDRVVHHALVNILQPIYEPLFIYDSYASRKGKGTLKALDRFDSFLKKATHNGLLVSEARTRNHVKCFVLKADIKKYFETVDHNVLLNILSKKIKDENVLWLTTILLENYTAVLPGKGMPLGNWTSQFFANVYLNELDQFVKNELKMEWYLRYVDDFVIIHRNKKDLEVCLKQIRTVLSTLKLELHPTKCTILPISRGVDILGFKVFYKYRRVQKKNIRKIHKKIALLLNENNPVDTILNVLQGWNEYALHGNSYGLRRKLSEQFFKNTF